MRNIVPIILICLLTSCKSTKKVTKDAIDTSLKSKEVITNHYENQLNFSTLRGRVRIKYEDGDKSQGVGVTFRMEKDKAIWISAPLGVVKAYITPNKVSFYNKLDKEYFEGDFSYLSDLLGTEVDFTKVQNLLLGNAFFDLREQKYNASILDGNYVLKPKKGNDLYKLLFMMDPITFRVASQQVSQDTKDRILRIEYSYQNIDNKVLPKNVHVIAKDEKESRNIDLSYNNMEFNQKLNFPYKVPKGYKSISLGK